MGTGQTGVSTLTATSLVVANMIGTGVFTTLGFQAEAIRSPFVLLLLWGLGGLLAFCGALAYAELATALPRSGGEFHYLGAIYHPALGFLAGWCSVTVAFAAPVALASMAFGEYLAAMEPAISPVAASCVVAIVTSIVHLVNLSVGSWFQNTFTILKLTLVVGFIGAGFWLGEPQPVSFLPTPGDWRLAIGTSSGVALVYVLYAYSGWNAATYIAGELRDPGKTLPRALLLGTGIVLVLYVGLNAVLLWTTSLESLAGELEVGLIAATNLLGPTGGRWMGLLICLGLVSCISAMIWTGPRVAQVMGEDFRLLKPLAHRSGRGIPTTAILAQLAIVLALLLSATFKLVLVYTQFTLTLFSFLTVLGVFRLRRTAPNLPRPFRMWGYPVTPLLFLAVSGAMLVHLLYCRPWESLAGLLTLSLGLPIYWLSNRWFPMKTQMACLAFLLFTLTPIQGAPSPNETALFLAGLRGSDPSLEPLRRTPEWQRHAAEMEAGWSRFEVRILSRVRRWSRSELKEARQPTVFYPFSGPDFAYVESLFPSATTYLLCGLEPVGPLPAVDSLRAPGTAFDRLRASFQTLFTAGYFVTKDMASQLRGAELEGILPVLYVLIVRSGYEISSVHREGNFVAIELQSGSGARRLCYFSANLSNAGLARNRTPLSFLKRSGPFTTYIKSASYLIHGGSFSDLRDLILNQSSAVLQDDSGVPLEHFQSGRWTLRYYGTYSAPLNLFSRYYQPDLAKVYSRVRTKSLPFGAGYAWDPRRACLILAVARSRQ